MGDASDSDLFGAALATRARRRPPAMASEVTDNGEIVYRTPFVGTTRPFPLEEEEPKTTDDGGAGGGSTDPIVSGETKEGDGSTRDSEPLGDERQDGHNNVHGDDGDIHGDEDDDSTSNARPKAVVPTETVEPSTKPLAQQSGIHVVAQQELLHLCRWVPLRLTGKERKMLLLLEGALQISEYTDRVDVARTDYTFYGQGRGWNGQDAIVHEMKDFCRLVVGLYVASDLNRASDEVAERSNPFEFHQLLRAVFEVGRRYKIQNPTKMRTTYGKLMHILMDAVQQEMVEEIGADLFQPTQSVSLMLEPFGEAGHAFLNDPDLLIAASPIDYGRGISDSVDAASPGSTTDNNNNNIGEGTDDAAVARRGRGSSKVDEVGRMRQAKADAIRRIMARHTTNDDDGVNNEAGGGGGSGAAAPKLLPVSVAERCLHSIGDALSFISVSTASVEAMISLLLHFFDPHDDGGGVDNRSLRLRYGSGGSRLSHSHPQQFKFVLQTLLLWKEIIRNMYKLWSLTDQDLIGSGGHYVLRNTGQGMNRVQSAPKLQSAMSEILGKVQREVATSLPTLADLQANEPEPPSSESDDDSDSCFFGGMRIPVRRRGPGSGWVGLSVVHLGDRDVPNALFFIDKYQQVSRILDPIVHTVLKIGASRREDPALYQFVQREYGSTRQAQRVILQSYFTNGFDGSGDDGGSCIDGRLTSSWNWCSKLEKKAFYPLFLLTDFVGFDGDFRR